MTRLKSSWLKDMEQEIGRYETELAAKTGMDFTEIAACSAGISREAVLASARAWRVAVVPITTGLGVIGAFSHSVAAIARQAGFTSFVTKRTDVDGIYEAHQAGADILLMADDDRYLAVDLKRGRVSDNNKATARGYTAILERLAGGLSSKSVLVMGTGVVGCEMAEALQEKKADFVFFDKAEKRLTEACGRFGVKGFCDAARIKDFSLVLDATNEGGWLKKDMLHEDVLLAAPGVPLSLDEEAIACLSPRLVHDLLQIGTVAMLGELCMP